MKNLILFNNFQAVEPGNLLKTEAYAKDDSTLAAKRIIYEEKEADSLLHAMKPDSEKIINKEVKEKESYLIADKENPKNVFADKKNEHEKELSEKNEANKNLNEKKIYEKIKQMKIFPDEMGEQDFFLFPEEEDDAEWPEEEDDLELKQRTMMKNKITQLKAEKDNFTQDQEFDSEDFQKLSEVEIPKFTVFDLWFRRIELLFMKIMEIPISTVVETLIEYVGKAKNIVNHSVTEIQKLIEPIQTNHEEIQKYQSLSEKLFKYFTLIPTSIRDLKEHSGFLILEAFQRLMKKIESSDRSTIRNKLQIDFQTSYQDTFFKEDLMDKLYQRIVKDTEELFNPRDCLYFFGKTNFELMLLILELQTKLLKNLKENVIIQSSRNFDIGMKTQLFNQELILNLLGEYAEEINILKKVKIIKLQGNKATILIPQVEKDLNGVKREFIKERPVKLKHID
jgi:hypothetical protein